MKAPEKLYFEDDDPVLDLFSTKRTGNEVEYARTDVFIEKACEWLRTHSEDDYFKLIPRYNYCGAGNLNKKRMIEDFKKYMEE